MELEQNGVGRGIEIDRAARRWKSIVIAADEDGVGGVWSWSKMELE